MDMEDGGRRHTNWIRWSGPGGASGLRGVRSRTPGSARRARVAAARTRWRAPANAIWGGKVGSRSAVGQPSAASASVGRGSAICSMCGSTLVIVALMVPPPPRHLHRHGADARREHQLPGACPLGERDGGRDGGAPAERHLGLGAEVTDAVRPSLLAAEGPPARLRNAVSEYPRSAAIASMSLSSRAVALSTTPAGFPPSGALEKAVYRSTSGRGAFVVMLAATRGVLTAIPGREWRRAWAAAESRTSTQGRELVPERFGQP